MFYSIDPGQFKRCFMDWVLDLVGLTSGEGAVDGKTLRGAKTNGEKSPVNMVNAWQVQIGF